MNQMSRSRPKYNAKFDHEIQPAFLFSARKRTMNPVVAITVPKILGIGCSNANDSMQNPLEVLQRAGTPAATANASPPTIKLVLMVIWISNLAIGLLRELCPRRVVAFQLK